MKKNPGRKERRNIFFGNRREFSDAKQVMNERAMKKAARTARKHKGKAVQDA